MSEKPQTVLVFGVFDILHDGHRYFLNNAKSLGEKLIVAIAPDEVVTALKKNPPHNPLALRIKNLEAEKITDQIIVGDTDSESWNIFSLCKPDVVALGYDQENLGIVLDAKIKKSNLNIKIVRIKPFNDGSIHSSSLRKQI